MPVRALLHEFPLSLSGIINFYSARDALTGHVDHSEVDATAPLVSISYVSLA